MTTSDENCNPTTRTPAQDAIKADLNTAKIASVSIIRKTVGLSPVRKTELDKWENESDKNNLWQP